MGDVQPFLLYFLAFCGTSIANVAWRIYVFGLNFAWLFHGLRIQIRIFGVLVSRQMVYKSHLVCMGICRWRQNEYQRKIGLAAFGRNHMREIIFAWRNVFVISKDAEIGFKFLVHTCVHGMHFHISLIRLLKVWSWKL